MTIRIIRGDCRDVLKTLPDCSVDSVVCDPPYHLTTGKKGGSGQASVSLETPYGHARIGTGFMGMKWDGGDVAQDPTMWAECLRVLKPGGHLLAFSGTRTQHRMVCAIEDAGFEIRDQALWAYASGFPKSHNLDKERGRAICGCEPVEGVAASPERDVRSLLDADVPAPVNDGDEHGEVLQPIVPQQGAPAAGRAQLPAAETWGSEPGLEGWGHGLQEARQLHGREVRASAGLGGADGAQGRLLDGASAGDGRVVRLPADAKGGRAPRRPRSNAKPALESGTVAGQQEPQARGAWPVCRGCGLPVLPRGLGTALKPAFEPICVAKKPHRETVIANVLKHGTGALNIDGCRIEGVKDVPSSPARQANGNALSGSVDGSLRKARGDEGGFDPNLGRWPANLLHDGSPEVVALFPQTTSVGHHPASRGAGDVSTSGHTGQAGLEERHGDNGSAARFFWCPKTSGTDRHDGLQHPGQQFKSGSTLRDAENLEAKGNHHPTVKPTELMRYLCRLVTPPGGVVLDPFMGSGSTLKAAELEGFSAIGIELDPAYIAIAERRIGADAPLFSSVEVER